MPPLKSATEPSVSVMSEIDFFCFLTSGAFTSPLVLRVISHRSNLSEIRVNYCAGTEIGDASVQESIVAFTNLISELSRRGSNPESVSALFTK